jgi:tRNA(Ile)-lysidine synthase
VKFPLRVRHWRPGDVFSPLGMKGRRKKLQDFFSDLRLSRFEKEQVWLVLNADGHIVWVIGYRLDEQVRVDADTRKILKLEFQMD